MRHISYIVGLLCLLCLAASASAKPLAVDRVPAPEPLPPYFSVLPDPLGKLTYEAIVSGAGERFVPLQKGFPMRGTGPIWLRLSLTRAVPPGTPGYSPAHLAVNLGELPPGTTKVYLPSESDLPGTAGAVTIETVQPHEKIFLPDPGLKPINIYIHMDETPGLWFAPMVGPAPLNTDTFFPVALIFLVLIPAAAILCLLRAGKDRILWPVWVALFLACVLIQDLLPLPAAGGPFKVGDLPALLAPGLSLLLFAHIGRLLLRTKRMSPGADLFLLCGMVPGVALCLMPLVPGWSWLIRLFPIWPLALVFFLPLGIVALTRGQNGGLGWTGACFFGTAGAACTLAGLFFPMPDLAASAWLWGLAAAGVCLTLAGSPREQRSLAEAIEADEAVLHNLPSLQLDAFTKGRPVPGGAPLREGLPALDGAVPQPPLQPVPQGTPQSTSQGAPQAAPEGMPQPAPQPMPQGMPQPTPQPRPQGIPQPVGKAASMPGAAPMPASQPRPAAMQVPESFTSFGVRPEAGTTPTQPAGPRPSIQVPESFAAFGPKPEAAPSRPAEPRPSIQVPESFAAFGPKPDAAPSRPAEPKPAIQVPESFAPFGRKLEPELPPSRPAEQPKPPVRPPAQAPAYADPALEFAGTKPLSPEQPKAPAHSPVANASPVVTAGRLDNLEAAANQWLAEAFGEDPDDSPAGAHEFMPAAPPKPVPPAEPRTILVQPEAKPVSPPPPPLKPEPLRPQAPAPKPTLAQPVAPTPAQALDAPLPKPVVSQALVTKPTPQVPEAKPTVRTPETRPMPQLPDPMPLPPPVKPATVQTPEAKPAAWTPEAKPAPARFPEPGKAEAERTPAPKPAGMPPFAPTQTPGPRPAAPAAPMAPTAPTAPTAEDAFSEPEAAAYRWLDAAFGDAAPPPTAARPNLSGPVPSSAGGAGTAVSKRLADMAAEALVPEPMPAPPPPPAPDPKVISLKDEDFSAYNLEGFVKPPRKSEPAPAEPTAYVFNLQTLMREVQTSVEKSASAKGLLLSWFVAPTVPPLLVGDTPRLRQALSLLLQNAVQACRRGAVQVTVRQSPDAQEEPDACTLLFAVSDSGSDRRTDAGFFQAWELASHSGGTFRVQYRPDAGTTIHFSVRFRLPTGQEASHDTAPAPARVVASESPFANLAGGVPAAGRGLSSSTDLPFSSRPSGALEGMITEMLSDAPAPAPAPDSGLPGVILADTTTGNKKLLGHYLKNLPIEMAVAQRPNQAQVLYADRPAKLVVFDADMPESDTASSIIAIRRYERDHNLPQAAIMALVGHDAQIPRMRALGCTVELRKPFSSTGLRNALAAALPAIAAKLEAIPETPPSSTYSPLDPERRLERLFVMPDEMSEPEVVAKPHVAGIKTTTVSGQPRPAPSPSPASGASPAQAPKPTISVQRQAPNTPGPLPSQVFKAAPPPKPEPEPTLRVAAAMTPGPASRPTSIPAPGQAPTAASRPAPMPAPGQAPTADPGAYYRPTPIPQSGPAPAEYRTAPNPAQGRPMQAPAHPAQGYPVQAPVAAPQHAPEPMLPGERALLDLVGADMELGIPEIQPHRPHAPALHTAPGGDLPGMPLEDLDESVPLELLPLVPGLIHALRDALRLCNQGLADGGAVFVQEASGRLADQSDSFGLEKLGKIARCVERAAEADDLEAVRTLLEDLDGVTQRYVSALQGAYDAYIKGAP